MVGVARFEVSQNPYFIGVCEYWCAVGVQKSEKTSLQDEFCKDIRYALTFVLFSFWL